MRLAATLERTVQVRYGGLETMKKRQKIVKLVISSCKDCPHCKIQSSPYTGDSFDMADDDWLCMKADKFIVVSERFWTANKTPIPQWCPL
jgi:hypothetical protein